MSKTELQRLNAELEKLRAALKEERLETRRWREQAMEAWARLDALKNSSALVAQADENKQEGFLLAAVIRQEWLQPDPSTGRPWRSMKDFILAQRYRESTVRRALRGLPKDARPKRGRPRT